MSLSDSPSRPAVSTATKKPKPQGEPTSPFSFAAAAASHQPTDNTSREVSPGESADEITPLSRSASASARRNYNTTTDTTTSIIKSSLSQALSNSGSDGPAAAAGMTDGSPQRVRSQGSIGGGRQRRQGRGSGRNSRPGLGGSRSSGQEEGDCDAEEQEEEKGRFGRWWDKMIEMYGSVELDNKGATARDHLALERTFLAWLRTSLAFASIGIAITQLFRLNTALTDREGLQPLPSNEIHLRQIGKPLGATFLGISILVLLTGGRRYFEGQYWIIRGKFPASRGSVILVTAVAGLLIVVSLVVVVSVAPTEFVDSSLSKLFVLQDGA